MRELTFLFTDIEGSTRLLERLTSDYVGVLERERELVTAAVEAAGGRVVDARGDEVFAAFSSADAGAEAALAAQRALAVEPWPDAVRVRMGLHSGAAAVSGDGYVGLAVHLAARVAQSAHGGEVLASEATVANLRTEALELRDLGQYNLRGIPGPTHLFRIVAPDMNGEFPQPRAQLWAPAGLTVALADDSVLLREGIAALLEDAGLEVVGQAGTAEDLLAVVDSFRPNVAIIDIRMPPTGTDEGIRAAAEIQARYPETSVLLLSSHVDVENALQLFRNGVSSFGYLLKDRVADVDEFVRTVGLVARGGTAIDSSIVSDLQSGLWSEKVRDDLFAAIAEAAIVGD